MNIAGFFDVSSRFN